jgi:uroporphyrinogen decarboxylase
MKFSTACFLNFLAAATAFSPAQNQQQQPKMPRFSTTDSSSVASSVMVDDEKTADPLLIRAAKGQKTERTPVWMMRQAGRHIKEYRELCKDYPTFRERSEIADVAVEVSLQPWRNYKTDGCILFSDILTPLPGMGADFVIDEKLGPIMTPIRTYEDMKQVRRTLILCRQICFEAIRQDVIVFYAQIYKALTA